MNNNFEREQRPAYTREAIEDPPMTVRRYRYQWGPNSDNVIYFSTVGIDDDMNRQPDGGFTALDATQYRRLMKSLHTEGSDF